MAQLKSAGRAAAERAVTVLEGDEAAEEIAGYESRFAKIEGELRLIKWMVTANTGLMLIVLGKLLIP
jgi:hypothetical protein